MPSPPKPWEQAGATGASRCPAGGTSSTGVNPHTNSSTTTSTATTPALPDRPSSLSTTASTNTLASTSPYSSGMGGYGGLGSTYGGLGSSYGSYASPYSRMGYGMGGMGGGYGGYGGYGSALGGYGGYGGMGMGMGMGGYGGMGMGMGGMPGQPGDVSLTQRMESGTQATFELISSIVGAFGGFAQMLESTFMATHSSFFAMVGVADQFAHLRNYLGQVLSIFALARYLKNLFLRLTGRAPAIDLDPREFRDFAKNGTGVVGPNGQIKARPSKRPLIVFFMAVIGLPYLMGKLVRLITAKQEAERLRLEQQGLLPPGAQQQQQQQLNGGQMQTQQEVLDPSKLTFVRALYTYNAADPLELTLKGNDIVAVLSKVDPSTGQESQWWKGRTRDGRVGWFPSTYVESLETAKERAGKLASTSSSEAKAIEAAPTKNLPKPNAAVASTN